MNGAFDPVALLQVLRSYQVDFIVIGGIAGRIFGSPTVTEDLDICYGRDRTNLRRLADALDELHARLRDANDVKMLFDEKLLTSLQIITLETDYGNLDIILEPPGTSGYSDLIKRAYREDLGGVVVSVTSLEDLIRMKEAAGRPKDLIEAEILHAVAEERRRNDM